MKKLPGRLPLKKAFTAALLLFLVLFAAYFIPSLYRLLRPEPGRSSFSPMMQNSMDTKAASSRSNYASEKIVITQGSMSQTVDQKYERVARLDLGSAQFDSDRAAIGSIAERAEALVQSENARGLPGSRVLDLKLGVVPEAFDATVESLKDLGRLRGITITKSDMTAVYSRLEARRLSLEKTLEGLKALRTTGAALSDLVALETKILDIEGDLQDLGVSLGDFNDTNSLCTIDISLLELAAPNALAILAIGLSALGKALLTELGIALVFLCAAGAFYLIVGIWKKVQEFRQGD